MAHSNLELEHPGGQRLSSGPVTKEVLPPLPSTSLSEMMARGLKISLLAPGEGLTVRTRNSTYQMVMLNSVEQTVLIRGGRYFPRTSEACLLGAIAAGKISIGWLQRGRRFGFSVGGRCFVTSSVVAIKRNAHQQASAA
jgi:hypothetical protein